MCAAFLSALVAGASGGARTKNDWGYPINQAEYLDLMQMIKDMPVFHFGPASYEATVLGEPFSVSIKKLGLFNDEASRQHIAEHWMPQLQKIMIWIDMIGICPVMFESMGNLRVIRVPDMSQGIPYVRENANHRKEYFWFWNNNFDDPNGSLVNQQPEKDVVWVTSMHDPDIYGNLRSPAIRLLSLYRSLRTAREVQDSVIQDEANPVQVLEHHPKNLQAQAQGIVDYRAAYGDAAAVVEERRRAARDQMIDDEVESMQMRMLWNKAKFGAKKLPLFWTSVPDQFLEGNSFVNNCFPLTSDFVLKEAARPKLVVDYQSMHDAFNREAALVLGFSLEMVSPKGGSHKQSFQGAQKFLVDRVRQMTTFLTPVVRNLFLEAYKKDINAFFEQENANRRRRYYSKDYKNAADVMFLYPHVDIEVNLSTSTVAHTADVRQLWLDTVVSKEYYAEHACKNMNIPTSNIELSSGLPDGVTEEMLPFLMGGSGGGGGNKKRKIGSDDDK